MIPKVLEKPTSTPEEFEEESGPRHAEASLVASTLTFVEGRQ
jgi:hypothetical protein